MRQVSYLTSRTWLVRAAFMVALVAAIVALGLFWSGRQSEAHDRDRTTWWLDCPTTSVSEGSSFDVYLIREPVNAARRTFGAWWHTDPGTADARDYVELPGTSEDIQWANDEERQANRQPRTVYTEEDPRVEHDETLTVRFTPTDNVHDINDPERDHKCEITIQNNDKFTGDIETSTDGTKVTITLNEGLKHHLLLNWVVNTFDFPINLFHRAVFDVKVDNRWAVPADAELSGRKITLTMAEPITEGQSVKVRYSNVFAQDSLGMFRNGAEITFPNFRATSGTNNSTVADADSGPGPWMPLDKSELTIDEGESGTFKVKLNKSPTGAVTVDVSNYPTGTSSGTPSLSLDKDSLTFNRSNWNQEQTVTATADEDSDAVNFWSLVTLAASGGGYEDYETYVKVLVEDDELLDVEGSEVSEASDGSLSLSMDEGTSATYGVKLKTRPAGRVEVSVTSDSTGVEVSPGTLTFNKNNWSSLQTVTLTAPQRDGDANVIANVRHTPSGSGYDSDHRVTLRVSVQHQ